MADGYVEPEHHALQARATCTARINGRRREMSVYWLDLIAVRDNGSGEVVDPDTGRRYLLTWDPETGYEGKTR